MNKWASVAIHIISIRMCGSLSLPLQDGPIIIAGLVIYAKFQRMCVCECVNVCVRKCENIGAQREIGSVATFAHFHRYDLRRHCRCQSFIIRWDISFRSFRAIYSRRSFIQMLIDWCHSTPPIHIQAHLLRHFPPARNDLASGKWQPLRSHPIARQLREFPFFDR